MCGRGPAYAQRMAQEALFNDPRVITDALAKRYCHDHAMPVEDGYDGMAALARSGEINGDALREIAARMEETWDDDLYAELEALEGYVKHHGPRGRQPGWDDIKPDYDTP